MSPFLVIAYYTLGNPYQQLSENLTKSCKEFNLPHFLKPIEDLGSWEKNTHYKANFISDCLERFSENLVYVDVDAEFKRYPDLFESLDCDIAYRTENFRWRQNEALSGTIFIRNNDNARSLVNLWKSINENNEAFRSKPDTWEQSNLQRATKQIPEVIYKNLPPEYTYIFDHTKTMYPSISPVIEHFQASRKSRSN
jgi:hypothetical protein